MLLVLVVSFATAISEYINNSSLAMYTFIFLCSAINHGSVSEKFHLHLNFFFQLIFFFNIKESPTYLRQRLAVGNPTRMSFISGTNKNQHFPVSLSSGFMGGFTHNGEST